MSARTVFASSITRRARSSASARSEREQFYPDLEACLATLERVGIPIVISPGKKGPSRPYSFSYAKRIVREARRAAGLPEHVR